MLPNCKQMAEQASENIDQPITGLKWFKMKLHMLMCKHCRLYNRKINLSSQAVNCIHQHHHTNEETRTKVTKAYKELHLNDKK